MMDSKPVASLSLDLDNQWSYMKTHGDPGWETFPSYLDLVIPRALDFFRERNLTITFFVVGQDAALDKNRESIASIARAGHEIGNHSFHHEQWPHLCTEAEIEDELRMAEEHIERVTGKRPVGYRGPGFSLSHSILKVLARREYQYDASTFPTYLGPLARAFYFKKVRMDKGEMEKRKALFGTFRDGLRPLKPYLWDLGERCLLEIPVTTMPLLKVPIHASYLLYLSSYSRAVAIGYFRAAIRLCCLTRTAPSLLLHPLDFLGGNDVKALEFFPAMQLAGSWKMDFVGEVLDLYREQFEIRTISDHARSLPASSNLVTRVPNFS